MKKLIIFFSLWFMVLCILQVLAKRTRKELTGRLYAKEPNKWGIAVLLFVTGMTLTEDSIILGFGVFGMLKNRVHSYVVA